MADPFWPLDNDDAVMLPHPDDAAAPDDVIDLPDPSSAFSSFSPAQPPFTVLTHLLHHPHHQDHHHLHRHRRFVATYTMMDDSRFNLALLVLFILSILAINAFFIGLILASRVLRSSSKHLLILGVSFADLIQGLLILPLITDLGNRGGAESDCTTFQVARLMADFLIPSISTLYILAINIDYILKLSCALYAEGLSRASILGALFVTPWLLSCILLIPIFVVSVQSVSLYNTFSVCHVVTRGGFARSLLVLSYILYGCLVLVFTLTVAILYLVKREYLGLDVTGERVHAPLDVCLASFLIVLFYTPIFLFTLLTTEGYLGCSNPGECSTLEWSYTLSLWLMFTKSWVLPMAWFFGRDTRQGIKHMCSFCA